MDGDDPSIVMLRSTLEAYLDNSGDVARTAAQLHIHRTTLYYRLGRLTAVHGVDLQDGLARTDLHLLLKMRRINLAHKYFNWTESFLTEIA